MNTTKRHYDLIGDIHGQYDKLLVLLGRLGYEPKGGTFVHPEGRKVVFLGDYVDRGPRIRDTLYLVRRMVDEGQALAIMGNHEYNAVAYATPDGKGGFLRSHEHTNNKQHANTLKEFEGREDEWRDWLNWFRELPMYLDLGELRAVHACWAEQHLPMLAGKPLLEEDFLVLSATKGTAEHVALETVLKGPEMDLPDGVYYFDKENTKRYKMRVRWWHLRRGMPLGELAMPLPMELPLAVEDELFHTLPIYPSAAVPVFFGHYWLPPEMPKQPLWELGACLDYSAGLGEHPMIAYRWNGEAVLDAANFVIGK